METFSIRKLFNLAALAILPTFTLIACPGGGGGGGYSGGGSYSGGSYSGGSSSSGSSSGGSSSSGSGYTSGSVLYYPYETVYGAACASSEPTPGCTFDAATGERITVYEDPHYNDYGHGTDDMWYVKFYSDGSADVFDEYGYFVETRYTDDFAGYIGGNTIGVGTSGLFWENVAGGQYWLGKNGVLYNANYYDFNYGEAINSKESSEMSDTNFAALSSETNLALVDRAATMLSENYGFTKEKAQAVASALNTFAVASVERGYTTDKDMDQTFKAVFGVNYSSALAAVNGLKQGELEPLKDLTQRSAAALGLKPHQAQKFIKGMYKKALAQWGYDIDSISW